MPRWCVYLALMFKVIMCTWNLTKFAAKKFNFTFSISRYILISFHVSGKLIFTKASGIKKHYFSHLILSIFKHSGRWIFFCRICNVKIISCIGPSA